MTAFREELITEMGELLRKAREWSLSLGGLHILIVLHEEEGDPLSCGEIAARLGSSKEVVTGLLNTLELSNLAVREYGCNPLDRRMVQVRLTERGKQAVDFITRKEAA